jgi:hypothetical protein
MSHATCVHTTEQICNCTYCGQRSFVTTQAGAKPSILHGPADSDIVYDIVYGVQVSNQLPRNFAVTEKSVEGSHDNLTDLDAQCTS